MNRREPVGPTQFALFRLAFGAYLSWHFAALVPYAAELFGASGVLPDPAMNPTHGILPNPLVFVTAEWFPPAFVGFLSLAALLFAAGVGRRGWALVLWFGWACLFDRNNLISNPSLPYIGLLLLFSALIPSGEPLRLGSRRSGPSIEKWAFPGAVFAGAWILMAAGYSFSGVAKLASPSWLDGTGFSHLLNNPLARPGWIRDLFSGLPFGLHAAMSWGVLAAEILFLPLALFRRGRLIAWTAMVCLHLGIVTVVDFADLTLGMLMLHAFTFDGRWLKARVASPGACPMLLFDGECGLCQSVVRIFMREDTERQLAFAPLQSDVGQDLLNSVGLPNKDFDSLVFFPDAKHPERGFFLRTAGIVRLARYLTGIWQVVRLFGAVPTAVRDGAYRLVASLRYRIWGEAIPQSELPESFQARLVTEPVRKQESPLVLSRTGEPRSGK